MLRFLGLTAGTAADVWNTDIGNVEACHGFLAVVDYPSTGLGIEIGTAITLGKPTLLVAQKDQRVTRMLLGAAEKYPHVQLARYDTMQDVPELVGRWLRPRVRP